MFQVTKTSVKQAVMIKLRASAAVRAVIALLICLIAASLLGGFATAANEAGDGVVLIYDAVGLDNIRNNLSGSFRLDADIDLSLTDWLPIGTNDANFTGIFDGAGHSISGLKINQAENKNVGLFGFVGSNGVVKDLNITIYSVTGGYNVGALVGRLQGTVSRCRVTAANGGTIAGSNGAMYVGGLVGYLDENGKIEGSTASVTVTVGGEAVAGGLVGYIYKGTVTESAAIAGLVTGANETFVGGLAGFVNNGTVERSMAENTVEVGEKGRVGGLIGGMSAGAQLKDAFSRSNVKFGAASNAGGLIGQSVGRAENVYFAGKIVSGDGNVGGLVGYNAGALVNAYAIQDSRFEGYNEPTVGVGEAMVGALVFDQISNAKMYAGFNFAEVWVSGNGTMPYLKWQGLYKNGVSGVEIELGDGVTTTIQLSALNKLTAFNNDNLNRLKITAFGTRTESVVPAFTGKGIYRTWILNSDVNGITGVYEIELSVLDANRLVLVTKTGNVQKNGWYSDDVRFTGANVSLSYIFNGEVQSGSSLSGSGEYTSVIAQITDDFGRTEARKLADVKIDKTKPEIKQGLVLESQKKVTFTVNDSYSGSDKLTVTRNGAEVQYAAGSAGTFTFETSVAGDYTVSATDAAGNSSTLVIKVTSTGEVKSEAEIGLPTIALFTIPPTNATGIWFGKVQPSFTAAAAEDSSIVGTTVECTKDGEKFNFSEGDTLSESGVYVLTITAEDSVGRKQTVSYTLKVDSRIANFLDDYGKIGAAELLASVSDELAARLPDSVAAGEWSRLNNESEAVEVESSIYLVSVNEQRTLADIDRVKAQVESLASGKLTLLTEMQAVYESLLRDADVVRAALEKLNSVAAEKTYAALLISVEDFGALNNAQKLMFVAENNNFSELVAAKVMIDKLRTEIEQGQLSDNTENIELLQAEYNALSADGKLYFDSTNEATVLSEWVAQAGLNEVPARDAAIKRAELLQMLYELEGQPEINQESQTFTDVDESSRYADAVAWGYGSGIVNGVGNDMFAPDQVMTREQLAKVVYICTLGSKPFEKFDISEIADSASVSSWAEPYVEWAVSNGVLELKDGKLAPQDELHYDDILNLLEIQFG